MTAKKSITKNALLNITKTIMLTIFPLITFPYAARVLLPDGIGKVNFVSAIISYFTMVAGLGIGTYGIREAAKKRDNKEELSKVVKELFFINILSTVFAYGILVLILFNFQKLQSYKDLVIVFSLTILFTTLGIDWLYNALEEYQYITIRSVGFQLISIVLLFIFVRSQGDYVNYASITVFSSVGSNIFNIIHSRKYIDWTTPVSLDLRKHIKPVFYLFGMRIAASIYTTLDVTMLGVMKTDKDVGFYTAANKITKIVIVTLISITSVLLPRLSYYVEKKESEKFTGLACKSFDVLLMITLPTTVGLYYLSENIIILLSGSFFLPAVDIMHVLCFLTLIIPIGNLLGAQILLPLGKEKLTFSTMIIGASVNFVLNTLLIPRYSTKGAAIASLLAELIIAIIYIILTVRYIKYSQFIGPLIQYSVSTFIMYLAISNVHFTSDGVLASIISSFLVGTLVYLLMLVVFRNKLLIEVLKKVKSTFWGYA